MTDTQHSITPVAAQELYSEYEDMAMSDDYWRDLADGFDGVGEIIGANFGCSLQGE